jgi:hypothetical protein
MTNSSTECEDEDEYQNCPTPDAHEKLRECVYFFNRLINSVHHPDGFRYNLSAFLQAARSVDYYLLNHSKADTEFDAWYRARRRNFTLELSRVISARNRVVHERILSHRSRVKSGIFRGRQVKLTLQADLPIHIPSKELLEYAQRIFVGHLIDKEHMAIGEQVGIERVWIVDELSEDTDVTLVAFRALRDLHLLTSEVHAYYGAVFEPADEKQGEDPSEGQLEQVRVLLETDLDPSLIEYWGW